MLLVKVEEPRGMMLSKIYRRLAKLEYIISHNKVIETTEIGATWIKFKFSHGATPLSARAEKTILELDGCLEISYESSKLESSSKQSNIQVRDDDIKKLKLIAQEIVNDSGSIATTAKKLMSRCDTKTSSAYLYHLGHEVGLATYEKDYAFGKPLVLNKLLKRGLAGALKRYGKMYISDENISIEDNSLCISGEGSCNVSRGFITAFINSNPKTRGVVVENSACISRGETNACSFNLTFKSRN